MVAKNFCKLQPKDRYNFHEMLSWRIFNQPFANKYNVIESRNLFLHEHIKFQIDISLRVLKTF